MVLFTVPEQESTSTADPTQHHEELRKLELKLKTDVDADFFLDPSEFKTLTRVIDILGAQLLESDVSSSSSALNHHHYNHQTHHGKADGMIPSDQLHRNNPAYNALKKQQHIVEDAIEHLSLNHYADLNASVVAVGKVSQRFGDAVGQVQGLKMQVQEIREHLTNASISTEEVSSFQDDDDDGDDDPDGVYDNGTPNGTMAMLHRTTTPNHNTKNIHQSQKMSTKHKRHPNDSSTIPSKTMVTTTTTAAAAAVPTSSALLGDKSLRELWLKKLECEAVLSLIQKLEFIRETPGAFDLLVHSNPCRIGAAVVALMNALNTMFEGDVTQIQGLHKITEQLMIRRQKAEEIVWETLQDIIYLRTGNFPKEKHRVIDGSANRNQNAISSGSIIIGGDSVAERRRKATTATVTSSNHPNPRKGVHASSSSITGSTANSDPNNRNKQHLYVSIYNQYNDDSDHELDLEKSSMDYVYDDFSAKSGTMGEINHSKKTSSSGHFFPSGTQELASSNNAYEIFHGQQVGQLLPKSLIDSELNLEVDELRCLENWSNNFSGQSQNMSFSTFSSDTSLVLPRYTDPILGLRILVEALAKLKRLDDVERVISENLERELKKISQMEQAKTLGKLEKRRNMMGSSTQHRRSKGMNIDAVEEKLRDFQIHLNSLLTAFGSVMIRLSYLAQILRHRISSDSTVVTPSYSSASSALHSVLVYASVLMEREVKTFLRACLNEDEKLDAAFETMRMVTPSMMGRSPISRNIANASSNPSNEQGIFSLGIINDASLTTSIREKYAQNLSLASRSSVMRMSSDTFVLEVLCPRTGVIPQIRHALTFRRALAAWTKECEDLKRELALVSNQDTSSPEYNATTEEDALSYLDNVIKTTLLPMMHEAADTGTISALERRDAFDPITGVGIYNSSIKGKSLKVEMCAACQGLYTSTGPLFSALPKLPRGGEMYVPIVASLEQAILLFISRVKSRILELCDGKYAFSLLEDPTSRHPTRLFTDMEARVPYTRLVNSYFSDDNLVIQADVDTPSNRSNIVPIPPSASDTKSKNIIEAGNHSTQVSVSTNANDAISRIRNEQEAFENEVKHLLELLNFAHPRYCERFKMSTEEDFLKTVALAHSLLKLASKLEKRINPSKVKWSKLTTAPRSLREAIKNIQIHGLRLAKFCRLEVLLQTVQRMSTIYKSSSLTAKDAVRLPSSMNSLGEYLNTISDLIREYGGNKIAAYALSSLEQYVPLFFMETVRVIATGEGLPADFRITLNGVESLDRCCSVLYRDLKSSTGFDNSFWDDDVAADAFERAATYIGLMELDMDELVSNWRHNKAQFNDDDWKIMFEMNGPRRRGDVMRYKGLKERMG